MTTDSYLSQFDLIGTGYFARKDPSAYLERLGHFRDAIDTSSKQLGNGEQLQILLLHSYGFASCEDLDRLCRFVVHLRSTLLASSIFLRAVVGPGSMQGEMEAFASPKDAGKQSKGSVKSGSAIRLSGQSLGLGTAFVFGEHYRFSGIGIRLVGLGDSEMSSLNDSTVSNFFVHSRSRRAEAFSDLGFADTGLSSESIDLLCLEYVRLRARFRGIGNHFVPIFISIIRSVNWDSLSYPTSSLEGDSLEQARLASNLYDRLVGQWYITNFGDVPSRELVLFTLLDVLHDPQGALSDFFNVVAQRCSNDWYVRRLEDVPDAVLSHDSREAFFNRLASRKPVAKPKLVGKSKSK